MTNISPPLGDLVHRLHGQLADDLDVHCCVYHYMHTSPVWVTMQCTGEYLPGACPAHARRATFVSIKYLISSPKFILTLGSPPSRTH